MKRYCLLDGIILGVALFFMFDHHSYAEDVQTNVPGDANQYVIDQPDKEAQGIIVRADRVRSPNKPITYKLRLIEYREGAKVKEQLLQVTMRFIKPSENAPGDAKSFVSFLEPENLLGDKMLSVFDQLWYYTPKARRPIRISRQQRLIGQVSNGDVVAADFHYSYESNLISEETISNKAYYKLRLSRRWPFVTYPKILYWVEKETYHPFKAEFFSSSDRLLKRAYYKDYRMALGSLRPGEIVIEEGLQKNNYTRMLYFDAQFKDVPDSYYQPSYLIRIK